MRVTVVGGGLAGCEAAFQLAERGIELTAWTIRDRGQEVTGPLLQMLFALGATTIITDTAATLATYAAV